MATYFMPPPYPRNILRDLAHAIAFAEKVKITISIEGPGPIDSETSVVDRRASITGAQPLQEKTPE